MVSGMTSNYQNKASVRPISIQKANIKNSKLSKDFKLFKDMRTRNPKSGIFKTSDLGTHLTNQSFQKPKKEIGKIKRIKNRRSSNSNSKSKSKHNKSMAEYISKPRVKVSSRTDSKFTGPLYTTFYQKQSDAITTTINKDSISLTKMSNRRKNSIKDTSKKISMDQIKLGKYHPTYIRR